ncbi:MAG: hypothetical protein AMXMBFR66_08140 [Pseudomonadota bacterium]
MADNTEPANKHVEQRRGDEHRGKCGNQARQAVRIEARKEGARAFGLVAGQRGRHYVAGDREEDIDAYEAAGQPPGVEVIQQHRDDGEAAQAVDVREVRRCRLRLGTRHSPVAWRRDQGAARVCRRSHCSSIIRIHTISP